jgi:NAD(P)H-hydrate epimerase
MGPGLGQSDDLKALVRWVLESVEIPTVLDADALNALAGRADLLANLKRPVVLTPHPGEFARLTGRTVAEIQADREGHAASLAKAGNLVVVLKGNATVVTDGARVYVNTTGNPGMAKGGSGDVLTGVIAALMAQHLPPFEAAQLGVYIHGLAGDLAEADEGEVSMTSADVAGHLGDAMLELTARRKVTEHDAS